MSEDLAPRSGSANPPDQVRGYGGDPGLTLYDKALRALAEAVRVDEARDIRDHAERLKFLARQAKDKQALADAAELAMRAERRLGELLTEAKAAGQIREGRPRKQSAADRSDENGSGSEQFPVVTLSEAGIDRKLSMTAQKLARFDAARFDAYIAAARSKILGGRAVVVNPVRDLTTADKALRRRIREAQLAARQQALPEKKYGVILADPEWRFEPYGAGGMDRAADNHYPTSLTPVIAARPVGDLAAPDCALFLWATVPMLPDALEVMKAWGFAYKSHWIWDKVEEGTGYWNRNRHELLVVGTRGSIVAPAPGTQRPSVMVERATVHSTKPAWSYAMIEEFYPSLAKIELNARGPRAGWDVWGYEAEPDPTPDQVNDNGIHEGPLPGSPGVEGMTAEDERAGAPEAQGGQTTRPTGTQSAPANGPIAAGGGVTDAGKPVAQAAPSNAEVLPSINQIRAALSSKSGGPEAGEAWAVASPAVCPQADVDRGGGEQELLELAAVDESGWSAEDIQHHITGAF